MFLDTDNWLEAIFYCTISLPRTIPAFRLLTRLQLPVPLCTFSFNLGQAGHFPGSCSSQSPPKIIKTSENSHLFHMLRNPLVAQFSLAGLNSIPSVTCVSERKKIMSTSGQLKTTTFKFNRPIWPSPWASRGVY